MNLDQFLARHAGTWSQLDALVKRAGKGARHLGDDEVDELLRLYQLASTHLSYASTNFTDPGLINRLSQAVTVRPVGADVQGDGPLAKLARGEAKLKAGDLAGAVAEIESLDGRLAQVSAVWLGQAKARLAEDQAGVALDSASAALLAPSATSTAQ